MKRNLKYGLLCLALAFGARGQASTLNARSAASGAYTPYTVTLIDELSGFAPAEDATTDFTRTGMYRFLRADSTGYYHVAKIDGRWWLIDPDGYAGINMAVTSIENTNVQGDYDLIRKNGYNGIGNFISSESQTKNAYNTQNVFQFSYSRRVPFHANYLSSRSSQYTTSIAAADMSKYVFVLDPDFEGFVQSEVNSKIRPCVGERDLLGWFTDNEIPFNQDQLKLLTRDLPATDPSRIAALVWAAEQGISEEACVNGTTSNAQQEAFAIYLAETYYSIVERQIRVVDSVHMILGSRLHGRPRAIQGVVNASHAHTDVTSVNFYDKFCPNDQIARSSWTNDHPCLVGEFYVKDANFYKGTQAGAGWYVNGQADRGRWYQNTCLQLLQNKCFIGWHYFRYMDDGTSNKGMVNANRQEYTDMTQFMRELNQQVYRLVDYFDGIDRARHDETSQGHFTAIADTYTILGSAQQDNFGSETSLQVMNNLQQAKRKEAFFNFDIQAVDSLLPYLKHAELQITCSGTDNMSHNLFVSGLEDNGWQENTLCGALEYANDAWKTLYNRLGTYDEVPVANQTYCFDVTNWLLAGMPASFKIHALTKTDTPVRFYSREAGQHQPKLILTFWGEWDLPSDYSGVQTKEVPTKVLHNGQILIRKGEHKYTILGMKY